MQFINNLFKVVALAALLPLLFMQCNSSSDSSGSDEDKAIEPVDSAMLKAEANFSNFCSSCHGEQMQAFVDRKWLHGKEFEDILKSIRIGYPDTDMISWESTFSEDELVGLANYIVDGIKNVDKYDFDALTLKSDTFKTETVTFSLDTIVTGIEIPWGMAFLPNNDLLVTAKSGELYRVDGEGNKTEVDGTPASIVIGQGGLLDVELDPDFENNKWVYLTYAKMKIDGADTLAGTAASRGKLNGTTLTEVEHIFEAPVFTKKRNHFGSRLEFDRDGLLYITVGDRHNRDENPQSLESGCGKVHRINSDGSIPEDNPFVNTPGAIASIYSYGHRNQQGSALHPTTGELWAHEHGPRGGDEINIIKPGLNYGWPVVSYGINYNATTFTDKVELEGMESPLLYWVPSIAPSGMTFVTTDKYKGWEGNLMVGSLRFKYLNHCVIEDGKVVKEEILMKNIGRVRNVQVGRDGYIYVAVEKPGFIFRLMPIE